MRTTEIICLGDSRIIPIEVLNRHKVIGNHGAILPYVQGGASLVWGRMLNTGMWGISIMELEKTVDSGKILNTKHFVYNRNCSMQTFVNKADDATIEALFEYLNGSATQSENSKWHFRVAKKTDAEIVINILQECLIAKKNIYLPPRTPQESEIKNHWRPEFVKNFKKANSDPYPKCFYKTGDTVHQIDDTKKEIKSSEV